MISIGDRGPLSENTVVLRRVFRVWFTVGTLTQSLEGRSQIRIDPGFEKSCHKIGTCLGQEFSRKVLKDKTTR